MGVVISRLSLRQVLLGHLSPVSAGEVERQTRIPLFHAHGHFLEDLIVKLTNVPSVPGQPSSGKDGFSYGKAPALVVTIALSINIGPNGGFYQQILPALGGANVMIKTLLLIVKSYKWR